MLPKIHTRTIAAAGIFADAAILEYLARKADVEVRLGFSDRDITEMARVTTHQMKVRDFVVPVKYSHQDAEMRLRGAAQSLTVGRQTFASGLRGNALDVGYVLNEPFQSEYRAEHWPNVSIEYDERWVDESGKSVGLLLTGFALLGSKQPALIHLPRAIATFREIYPGDYNAILSEAIKSTRRSSMSLFSFGRKRNAYTASPKKREMMTPEMLDEALARTQRIVATADTLEDGEPKTIILENAMWLQDMYEMMMEAGPEPEIEEGKKEAEPEPKEGEGGERSMTADPQVRALMDSNKQLLDRLDSMEKQAKKDAEAAIKARTREVFNELHAKGVVVKEDLRAFETLANGDMGLDGCRNFFESRAKKADTPNGKALENSDSTGSGDERAQLIARYRTAYPQRSKEAIEKMADTALVTKKEIESMKAGI